MEYRYLGNSGLKVSAICLGAMTFGLRKDGSPGQLDEKGSHELLDAFVAKGGNFIDTANVYSDGQSELIVGSWLAKQPNRSKVVIATKVRFPVDLTNPNGVGLSRKHILDSVQTSLQRLQTPYIDLLQTHCWDEGTPIEETLNALKYLVDTGKVLYIGVSNLTGWQFQKIIDYARSINLTIVSMQAQYSLLCRQTEWEVDAVCKSAGVAMLPWSPLKGGWLSGKFKHGMTEPPEGSRVAWSEANKIALQSAPGFTVFNENEHVWKIIDALENIAKTANKTVAQVALRWLLEKRTVSSVVIGAKRLDQLEDNLGAVGWSLTAEQVKSLDDASAVALPYPYEMVFRAQIPRARN